MTPLPPPPPVSVLYGGAHRFAADTPQKLAALARSSLAAYAPEPADFARALGVDPSRADGLYAAVSSRLEGPSAVDDLRIDFEDGYGPRPDPEEDRHADRAGEALAQCQAAGGLPPWVGLRVKAFSGSTEPRARRTLERFLRAYRKTGTGSLPEGFVVTLPKVEEPETVRRFVGALETLEGTLGLAEGAVGVELMVETPRALLALPGLAMAAGSRLVGLHLGAYDLLSALGVLPSAQSLDHPQCVAGRVHIALVAAALGVRASDGATTRLPLPVHRGAPGELSPEQVRDNKAAVVGAWGAHARAVRAACSEGVWLGWDLHPAQLPARYGALYEALSAGIEETVVRLTNFVAEAARATRVGQTFDDAATARGLVGHVRRAGALGVIDLPALEARLGLDLGRLFAEGFGAMGSRPEPP